jgi:3-oxoacyl-[acyl-carrier protein] reductase
VKRLNEKAAIVTGASRGIGRAIAVDLAAEGAAVVVNYRAGRDEAEQVVAHIQGEGGRAVICQADVSDEAQVRHMTAFTLRELGGVDVLVTNAGVVCDQLAAAMTVDQWEAVIQTNLRGPFLCIRAVLPHMLSQRAGSIVTISSIAAERGGRGQVNYAAAKGGLNALTRSLATELAPRGVRVNAVAPGMIVTNMTKRVRHLAGGDVLAQIPLGRFGEPRDVARAVTFLASADASYITGQVLHVTGGLGL